MAISSTTNKNTYSGDGSTVNFTYAFRILDDDDILVQIKDVNGTITTQIKTTDYTVSGVNQAAGGNVAFVTAPSATDTVILTRNVPLTQEVDYTENDTFPAETHEQALDKLTMQNQQQQEEIERTMKFDASLTGFDTTFPGPIANGYLKVNGANTALEFDTLTTNGGLSAIVQDTTPQLGANLDTNSFHIQFDDEHGIQDDSGNYYIRFDKRGSATNYFIVQNAATSDTPTISVDGGDPNVSMEFQVKGTGKYEFLGTADDPAEIRLYEDTSNGTNYMALKSPDAVTSNTTLELPNGDGNVNQHLVTSGAGVLSWASGMVKISETVASSASQVAFTGLTSDYRAYLFVGKDVLPATDNVLLNMQVSSDNGSTWATTGYYFGAGDHIATVGYVSVSASNDAAFRVAGGMSNASAEFIHFEAMLQNPDGNRAQMRWSSGGLDAATRGRARYGSGFCLTTAADAVRFIASSGNLNGTFTLYGIPA